MFFIKVLQNISDFKILINKILTYKNKIGDICQLKEFEPTEFAEYKCLHQ